MFLIVEFRLGVICTRSLALIYVVLLHFSAVYNQDDLEARSNMHLASVFAGIGFGNAGVHLWYVKRHKNVSNVFMFYACRYCNFQYVLI